jgi:hypothetical protein
VLQYPTAPQGTGSDRKKNPPKKGQSGKQSEFQPIIHHHHNSTTHQIDPIKEKP